MDDELESFIREQKERVAEDKASLEQDPPYMEIKAKPYRAYVSTVKENIPPKSSVQGKEESCSVGLPLGVEYERKKQRLQQELRMDYRRYMAQKKQFAGPGPLIHLDNWRSAKQRPNSQRDAATLTEDSRGLHRALRLAEVKTLNPEEEEEEEEEGEHSSGVLRLGDRLGRPAEQESGSEEGFEEELELMEGRKQRHAGAEAKRSNKTAGREKKETPVGARHGRRSRTLTKKEEAEFATGLMIGAADTEDALRRRKERYRQELQEQIAEQQRNKKREKDLELKVAATGANDPEKQVSWQLTGNPRQERSSPQPDRIRQFGLCGRKDPRVLELSPSGGRETPSRISLPNHEKLAFRDREMPPPEQPHVAFQSPLLGYSSSLGGGGLSPSSQPAAPAFPRAVDTPRLVPPHATLHEAYRSPYGEPRPYGSRNLLDPHMAYYGHLPVSGPGPPVSFWSVPQGGTVPNQFGTHSPHSQRSASSFPEPTLLPSSEAAGDSQVRVFPSERSRSTRERIMSYREALKQQIQEQQERRLLEREEAERYEAQLEADMKNRQPWGRGGGGAPLRDSTGNLIADLNQMHKLNEEAYINPEQWQRRTTAELMARRAERPDLNERISGFTHVQTPQFARGNVFANHPTQQQLQEQDKYKAYLKQQIDEKMHKKAEERERIRLEEEKEERRLAEQRARIQREYEEEQEKKKRKEMEQKAKNEELVHLAEQRKKEAERQKKEAEEKESAVLRRQYERERQARVEEVRREPSPPIFTLQKKHGRHQYTPRPPTVDSQHSTVPLSERSLSGLQSPPVPACRNQLRAAGSQLSGDRRNVFSELSALRRQLRSEQKRLEVHLQQGDWEELDSPLSDRHRERPPVDVFDMARLRLQAPVRRPNSRKMEPRNLQRIHDSLQLQHADGESRQGFGEVMKPEGMGVTSGRRRDYRNPYQRLSSQRSTAEDDYFDLSPPQQSDYLRSVMGGSARGSLLESESAFIDPLGEAFPQPRTPEYEKSPLLSARERRRLAKQSQHPQLQDRAASSRPFGRRDDYTADRLQQEAESSGDGRRRDRTGRLIGLGRRGDTAGPADLSDDDSSPPQFSLHNLNHQSSVETVDTDPWLRPGTSDTLKCLERPSRTRWQHSS